VTTVVAATFREAAAADDWPLPLAALWTGALAAHAAASLVFRRLHSVGFSHTQEGKHVARFARLWARLRGRPLPADGAIRAPAVLAPAVDWIRCVGWLAPRGAHREMVIKDAKLLLRDASQWSQLVLLLALVFVYLYNFRHFRQIGEAGLVSDLALYLLGMGLSGFVTTAVSVRFAFPLVSLEGQILWLLRSSPLQPRQILVAKLLATLPPLILVAEVMSIASSLILGVSPRLVALGAVVAACTSVSVASLSVGIGALLPDYRAESAAKVAASFGGLVCMSAAMLVALLLVGFALYPAWALHHAEHVRHLHRFAAWRLPALIGSIAGGLLVTGLSVMVPLSLGARAFGRHEP
jgi:ABC-2 type transport system permease protein